MDPAQRTCYRCGSLSFVFAHRPTSTHWQRGRSLLSKTSPRGYLRDALYHLLQNTNGRPSSACLALHSSSHPHHTLGALGVSYFAYHQPYDQTCARRSLRLRNLSHSSRSSRYHRTTWRKHCFTHHLYHFGQRCYIDHHPIVLPHG